MTEGTSIWQAALKMVQQKQFYNEYFKVFDVVDAQTPEMREKIFRLRYEVFCIENQYEDVPLFPEQCERDSYDERARHFGLIHKATGDIVGTLRLILPDDENQDACLPVQRICDHPLLHSDKVLKLCQISRFCMSRRFRQRPRDGRLLPAYYEQEQIAPQDGRFTFVRRVIPYAPLGLWRAAFQAALEARLMDCVLLVEPNQMATLKRLGVPYRVMGPRLTYHGTQQPVVFNIKNALDHMMSENPECWDVVSDQGRLAKLANTMYENDWQDQIFDDSTNEEIYRHLQ